MSRIRTTKPEFWTSGKVAGCSIPARLLFIGMWNYCDDGGVHRDDMFQLKAGVFPGDSIDVGELVDELIEAGLIVRYEVEGKGYLRVVGWHDHQKIDQPRYVHPWEDGKTPPSAKRRRSFAERSPNTSERSANSREPSTNTSERSPQEGNGMEGKGNDIVAPSADSHFDQVGLKVLEIIGSPNALNYGRVSQWLADGADPEKDIYPVVEAAVTRGADIASLKYFDQAIANAMATRTNPMPAGVAKMGGSYDPNKFVPETNPIVLRRDADFKVFHDKYLKDHKCEAVPGALIDQFLDEWNIAERKAFEAKR